MITTINEWRRLNEDARIIKHKAYSTGDMVYVDPYGPRTYSHSDNNGSTRSDKPFRPLIYNFSPGAQYEVIDVNREGVNVVSVGVFDDNNEYQIIPAQSVSKSPIIKEKTEPVSNVQVLSEKKKMSKAARKFISDKIKYLIDEENRPRKQAVAMSYSYAEKEGLI